VGTPTGLVGAPIGITEPVVGTPTGLVGSQIGTVMAGEVGTSQGLVGSGSPPEGAMRVGIQSKLG
jgi:hypothetical protein